MAIKTTYLQRCKRRCEVWYKFLFRELTPTIVFIVHTVAKKLLQRF